MRNEHQTNRVIESMSQKICSKRSSDNIPFSLSCNTHVGRSIEILNRTFLDELKTTTDHLSRDKIAAKLTLIDGFLSLVKHGQNGWYCFYCGWLESENVTNDERCAKCGSILPK